eukprot:723518-Prymnesium_polylepis.1
MEDHGGACGGTTAWCTLLPRRALPRPKQRRLARSRGRRRSVALFSPVVTFPSEEGPPRPVAAGARPGYHPLPPLTKCERGARPAAALS